MSKYSSVHPKMDRAERAKQFMPFAALKGYEEALRAKEQEMLYKAENQLEIEILEDNDKIRGQISEEGSLGIELQNDLYDDISALENYDFGDS